MTRRGFIALSVAPRVSPRNVVANKGNEFISEWGVWANALNATPPGGISVEAAEHFTQMGLLFRQLERAWKEYIR